MHRVGSITTGFCFIVFGILFLVRTFVPEIDYRLILEAWPLVLIGLGIEVLVSNFSKKTIVYDKGAIALMFVMVFFVLAMAGTEYAFGIAEEYRRYCLSL